MIRKQKQAAPAPSVLDAEGAEGGPSRDNGSGEPERVEDGHQGRTVRRVRKLRDEQRAGILSKCCAETNQPTGGYKFGM